MPKHLPAAVLALLLLAAVAWHIYSGWGLVTLDVRDAPVSRVLASIERQAGVEIASNLPPDTKVTIKVRRVPAVEAIDIVAVRTDASWRLFYLGAPDKAALDRAVASFEDGSGQEGWTAHGGGGFGAIAPASGAALDLRRVRWTPSGPARLHDVLADAALKTGVSFAAPSDWNPEVTPPAAAPLREAAPALIRAAGGVPREVFLVRADGDGRDGGEISGEGRARGGGGWIGRRERRGDGEGRGGWAGVNAEAAAERVEAQIALLPPDEQARAREDFDKIRKFWEEVRSLPEDERRAKAREFFTSPEMAERMEERRLARDAKRTPEQRNERSRRYFERKEAAQAAQQGTP